MILFKTVCSVAESRWSIPGKVGSLSVKFAKDLIEKLVKSKGLKAKLHTSPRVQSTGIGSQVVKIGNLAKR